MSMQEKIIETAKEWYPANSSIPQSLCHRAGFIEGGKWATEFLVEKACDWLRRNYTNYMIQDLSKYVENVCSFDIFSDSLIDDFREAMEE